MQISANHLKIGYDDKIVVPDFDVIIHKHDITTFIDPNGCGKSTILKALTRILKCGGVIEIDGNSIHTMPTKEVAKKIAILSQQQTMPPDITVEELVGFGRMPYQKFLQRLSDEDKKIVDWAMEATSVSPYEKTQHFCIVRR
ncbi:MAG: ABC transporter ATP-binding protein [Eubacteriales bacterium]